MMVHHPVMELSASWRGPGGASERGAGRDGHGRPPGWARTGSYPARAASSPARRRRCATKKGWTTANPHVGGVVDPLHRPFGAMSDHWNMKHRTWKVAHAATWPPTANPRGRPRGSCPHPLVHGHVVDGLRLNADVETDDRRRRLDGSLFARLLLGAASTARRTPPAPQARRGAARLGRRDHDQRDGHGGGRAHRRDGRLHDPARGRRKAIAARRRSRASTARRRGGGAARRHARLRRGAHATANYPPPSPAPPPPNSSPPARRATAAGPTACARATAAAACGTVDPVHLGK